MIPSLSIVIPSHNRPDLLRGCLATVRLHAPPDVEIIVVDDSSPNGAARIVAQEWERVRVVSSRGCGFCAAANTGVRAARGTIVELLNDDTEVAAGWASAALQRFQDPRVAAVAPLVLQWPIRSADPLRIDSAGDRYYIGGVAAKRGHGELLGPEYLYPGPVFGASASSAFFRRQILLQVGAFPDTFGAYFEDVDLAFRLHRAGYQVVFEPAARVFHRGAASYGRLGRRLLEQQSRNEERVFWRNLPVAVLFGALPRHFGVLLGKAWLRWQDGGLIPFLCGRLRLLGEIPDLLRHRRRLHRLHPSADIAQWGVESGFWPSLATK